MSGASADSRTAQKLRLSDGRVLGFAEYGDPGGRPVLEFHGWPGCRLEAWNYDEAGKKTGARIIGIDRPGFGISTRKKGYRIIDWPRDVAEFADGLGLERFAVAAISSGAPYGLACAALIPERLTGCAIVSGVAPFKVPGEKIDAKKFVEKTELQMITLSRVAPWAARAGFWYILRQFRRNPDKAIQQFAKGMPKSDTGLLQDEAAKRNLQATMAECARRGTKGPIEAIVLEGRPWGFRLDDIKMHVSLWQGEDDNLTPPAGAAYMASRLPNHTLHTIPDAGHLTVVAAHAEDVLRELLSAG